MTQPKSFEEFRKGCILSYSWHAMDVAEAAWTAATAAADSKAQACEAELVEAKATILAMRAALSAIAGEEYPVGGHPTRRQLSQIKMKALSAITMLCLLLSNVQAEENTDLRATLVSPLKSEAILKVERDLRAMMMDHEHFSFASTPPVPDGDFIWIKYVSTPWIKVKKHLSYEERVEFARKWTSPAVFAAMMEGKVLR